MLRLAYLAVLVAAASCNGRAIEPQLDPATEPAAVGSDPLAHVYPAAPACEPGSSTPLIVDLPTKMVEVRGNVGGGNVTSLEFQSARTGVRYSTRVDATGAFSRPLPSGSYTVELKHQAQDFRNSRPAQALDIPAGVAQHDYTPCAGTECFIEAEAVVPRSTDPARTGRLSGRVVLASGSAATALGVDRPIGSVRLIPLIAGEGDPEYGMSFGADMAFDFTGVAYGKYKIIYRSALGSRFAEEVSQPLAGLIPVGQWIFAETVEIQQPETNWQGSLPLQPVRIQVQVNNKPLADNSVSADPRGSVVIRGRTGEDIDSLPLGAAGPASFELMMIPGTYEIGLESYVPVGHGLLKQRNQDVLPTGMKILGSLEVAASATPLEASFNADVRQVLLNAPTGEPARMALDLKGAHGAYVWANLATQVQTPTIVYAACHVAEQGETQGPTTSGFAMIYEASLGEFCVPCAQ